MPDEWRRVDQVLRAALSRPPEERDRFLRDACASDTALENEVRSLLAADEQAGSFLEDPAIFAAARALADDHRTGEADRTDLLTVRMALSPGTQLGPYEISAQIGAGGMGEVYEAIDTNLARRVAIKVLPDAVAADPERLALFDREAKTLAALNHPNIAAIYGLERSSGTLALVMELVEGPTLADRIAQGAVRVADALPIARQIAGALAAAHEQGIIHRDLKPANIKLRPDGTVKVLDFGLATHTGTVGPDEVTRLLNHSVTEVGRVVGTPAYMAPEQVHGKASAGTDLFAFGLVLYEMVAGRLPFPGASLGSMLASRADAVIQPPCQTRSPIAARLNALILGLLERDPARRPKSAAAVRQELLALGKTAPVRPAAMAAVVASAIVLAAGLWWSSSSRARRSPEVSRVDLITTYEGDEATPSVSPDGALVAFSWAGEDGKHQGIYVTRSDGQEEPRQLTRATSPDTVDLFPAWSPDQTQIAFVRRRGAADGEIIVIPAQGGPERELRGVRFVSFPAFKWLAWTPDGAQIAFASQSPASGRSTVFLMRLDGTVRSLTTPPAGVIGDASPDISPDGRSLAFVRWSSPSASTLLVQTLDDEMKPVGEPATVPVEGKAAGSPVWADNTRLFFTDVTRILEWEAGAAPEQVYTLGARLAGIAIARRETSGSLRIVAAQQNVPGSRVWTIPLRAAGVPERRPEVLSHLGNTSNNPDYSPDGKRIVFVSSRSGNPELWMTDADGGDLKQLTRLGVQRPGVPRWSPDNRHVAFFVYTGTEPQTYVIDATEDQPHPQQLTHDVPGCNLPTWSRNGESLYCSRRIGGSELQLHRVAAVNGATGEHEMERLFEGKSAIETSDGRVLYIKNDRPGLFARSLAGDPTANPEERLVEDIQGPFGYFVPVAQGVYYTGQDSRRRYVGLRFFDYAQRRSVEVAPGSITGPVNSLTVTPDGRRLVYTRNPKDGIDLSLIQFQ
jgi:serine/threonine protein kinase/Tol biopolymer transport system component